MLNYRYENATNLHHPDIEITDKEVNIELKLPLTATNNKVIVVESDIEQNDEANSNGSATNIINDNEQHRKLLTLPVKAQYNFDEEGND